MNSWFRNPDNLCMLLWEIKYSGKLSSLFHPPNVSTSNFCNVFRGLSFSCGLEKDFNCVLLQQERPLYLEGPYHLWGETKLQFHRQTYLTYTVKAIVNTSWIGSITFGTFLKEILSNSVRDGSCQACCSLSLCSLRVLYTSQTGQAAPAGQLASYQPCAAVSVPDLCLHVLFFFMLIHAGGRFLC